MQQKQLYLDGGAVSPWEDQDTRYSTPSLAVDLAPFLSRHVLRVVDSYIHSNMFMEKKITFSKAKKNHKLK